LNVQGIESIGYDTATRLAQGIREWVEEGPEAAELVWPLRDVLEPIGGSHAQQKLFNHVIINITQGPSPSLATSQLASQFLARPNHRPTIDALLAAIDDDTDKASVDAGNELLIEDLRSRQAILAGLATNYDVGAQFRR